MAFGVAWSKWQIRRTTRLEGPPRGVAHLDYTALQAQLDSHFTNVRGFVLKSAPVNG
jgi:hypothetical protein